jgi:hypothetical protein
MRQIRATLLAVLWIVPVLIAVPVSDGGQVLPIKPESVPAYQPKHYPFEGGEKAVYRGSWNGLVSVATAEIYTVPTVVAGRQVYNVRVEAKTSRALDLVWKMRDTIHSTFDARGLIPSRFTFHQRENARVIDTEARYDEATKRWVVNRQQVGKRRKSYDFESQNTLDPLTAVYLARSIDFKAGDRLYFNLFGGRYRYLLELYVERKEPVTMGSGKIVEAYKIIPRLQNVTKRGYAERLNEAVIWISADARRLPIKLSSKIVFGSVYVELVEDKQAAQSTAIEPAKAGS